MKSRPKASGRVRLRPDASCVRAFEKSASCLIRMILVKQDAKVRPVRTHFYFQIIFRTVRNTEKPKT